MTSDDIRTSSSRRGNYDTRDTCGPRGTHDTRYTLYTRSICGTPDRHDFALDRRMYFYYGDAVYAGSDHDN